MAISILQLPLEEHPQPVRMKRCSKCRERKPLSEFYDRTDQPGRKKPSCKICHTADQLHRRRLHPEIGAQYRKNNPEKFKRWQRQTYENARRRLDSCISMAIAARKRQCKKKDIPFSITADDVLELFSQQNGICALTGRQLRWGEKGRNHDTLSVDRIDGPTGYVPGNIRLIVDHANLARNQYSDSELLSLCEDILVHHGYAVTRPGAASED